MNLFQTFPLAVRALLRNKTRSLLTALGVVIGVASVISMVAIGAGARERVEAAFAAMGTNLLIVTSGSTNSGGVMGGMGTMPTLTWDDLRAIRTDAPAVALAAPQVNTRATLVGEGMNWMTSVTGTSPEFFELRGWKIAKGSFFENTEVEAGAKVIVLGATAAEKLFGSSADPIGQTIRVKNVPFLVIGVMERKGQSPFGQDYDDTAIVPVSTFQSKIQGGLQKFIAGVILVGARSASDTRRAEQQMALILRDRHHIASANEDDFGVRNLTELASAQQQGTETLTSLLASIAIVSLLVGGIGIMNIMLVSVTERTREIGIRMAVGAKPWHVMAQFLVEAVTLSLVGGLLGLALGAGVAELLASQLGWALVLRVDVTVLAIGFSALVGVIFGIYPAQRAARLDPIEALRFE
ncbi:MAG: ABC transporter permease [Myxococcota bacterium]